MPAAFASAWQSTRRGLATWMLAGLAGWLPVPVHAQAYRCEVDGRTV
jgi:hypothetical protein